MKKQLSTFKIKFVWVLGILLLVACNNKPKPGETGSPTNTTATDSLKDKKKRNNSNPNASIEIANLAPAEINLNILYMNADSLRIKGHSSSFRFYVNENFHQTIRGWSKKQGPQRYDIEVYPKFQSSVKIYSDTYLGNIVLSKKTLDKLNEERGRRGHEQHKFLILIPFIFKTLSPETSHPSDIGQITYKIKLTNEDPNTLNKNKFNKVIEDAIDIGYFNPSPPRPL